MAYFPHAFQKMLVSNGSAPVAGGTHPKDLTAGQIALIDPKTNLAVVGAIDYQYSPMIYIAQGSYHTTDKVGPFHGGYKESVKTKGINPKYVSAFYVTEPANPIQDIVQICAVAGCDILCDRTYRLRVDIKGSPALRFLTHNVYYTLDAWSGCCTEVTPGAVPVVYNTIDPNVILLQWADQINNYPTTQPFIRATVSTKVLGAGNVAATATAAAASSLTVTLRDNIKPGDKITFLPTAAPTNNPSSAASTIAGNTFTVVSATINPFTVGMVLTGTGVAAGTTITSLVSGNGGIGSVFLVDKAQTVAATTITSASPIVAYVAANHVPATGAGTVALVAAANASTPTTTAIAPVTTAALTALNITSPITTATYVPATTQAAVDASAGCLELVGAYVDTVFQDCSFSPLDHVEYQPVELYASVSVIDVLGYQCAAKCFTITETQQAMQGRGFGETLIRELILSKRYLQEPWYQDPRYREVMDYNPFAEITRGNKYYVYHILHSVPRKTNPTGVFDNDQYLVKIVSPTRNAAFETAMIAYLISARNYEPLNGASQGLVVLP